MRKGPDDQVEPSNGENLFPHISFVFHGGENGTYFVRVQSIQKHSIDNELGSAFIGPSADVSLDWKKRLERAHLKAYRVLGGTKSK